MSHVQIFMLSFSPVALFLLGLAGAFLYTRPRRGEITARVRWPREQWIRS